MRQKKPSVPLNHSRDFDELVRTVALLRSSDGCPWDQSQTHSSLRKYLLEECYEALEAMDQADMKNLAEELGDVLVQVAFHGQIAREKGEFTLSEIFGQINQKLIRRHPHVFPAGTLESERDPSVSPEEAEINANWDAIKRQEKAAKADQNIPHSLVDDVPVTMPALTRAVKLQKKVSTVGFDWSDISGVLDKIREELAEVELREFFKVDV